MKRVYLYADDSVSAVRVGVGRYLAFYNGRRPNTALGDCAPDEALLRSRNLEKRSLNEIWIVHGRRPRSTHHRRELTYQPRKSVSTNQASSLSQMIVQCGL